MSGDLVLGFALAGNAQFGLAACADVGVRDLRGTYQHFGALGLGIEPGSSHVSALGAGHGWNRAHNRSFHRLFFGQRLAHFWRRSDAVVNSRFGLGVGRAGERKGDNGGGDIGEEMRFHILFRLVSFVGVLSRHP